MRDGFPRIIAHRGLRTKYPENTIPALTEAIELPLYGVEFDVDLSKDGVPIVAHQETLTLSSSGALQLSNSDLVRNWTEWLTAEEIRSIDAGSWFNSKFSHVRIPTLREALQSFEGSSIVAVVEMKCRRDENFNSARRIVDATVPVIVESLVNGVSCEILSFEPEVLRLYQSALPDVETIFAVEQLTVESIRTALDVGASVVATHDVSFLQNRGVLELLLRNELMLYTYEASPDLHSIENQSTSAKTIEVWEELIQIGVHGIESDYAKELVAYVRGSNVRAKN